VTTPPADGRPTTAPEDLTCWWCGDTIHADHPVAWAADGRPGHPPCVRAAEDAKHRF
jgi:hypothetical protein